MKNLRSCPKEPVSDSLPKSGLLGRLAVEDSKNDLQFSPIMKSLPIRQKSCGPHFEPILDGLTKLRSISRMNQVGRLDNPAVHPLDDKEEEGPVPLPDPVDKFGKVPDRPLRDRIGKEGPVSLPIGDALDLNIDLPPFFVPVEVVDAASFAVGDLRTGVNPSACEFRGFSGEEIPCQAIGPVGVDPHPDTGEWLGLFCPEAVSLGILRVERKG